MIQPQEQDKRRNQTQFVKPNFDNSFLYRKDGTISGSLFSLAHPQEEGPPPFLCGPIPVTNSNLLAWLMQGCRSNGRYEKYLSEDFVISYENKKAKELRKLKKEYHRRRKEMRILASKIETGGALIDRDMRLVTISPENRNVGILDRNGDDQVRAHGEIMRERDEAMGVHDVPDMLPALFGLPIHGEMVEEEITQIINERKEAEAAEVIKLAVERYRREGVPEDDFELIPVHSHYDEFISLTFRRICFAVFFVIGAFTCLMLQTIPLMDPVYPDQIFDKMLHELLNVRPFWVHVRDCGGLLRQEDEDGKIDCSSGVLHIPSLAILEQGEKNLNHMKQKSYNAYKQGVNVSWWPSCTVVDSSPLNCASKHKEDSDKSCIDHPPPPCFRGVHDGIITDEEVDSVLRLSALLVNRGGDHLEINYDVKPLLGNVPSVVQKLCSILRLNYTVPPILPVAFRISVSLPTDSSAMYGQHTSPLLSRSFNTTEYMKWESKIRDRYEWSGINLPPLMTSTSLHDPCVLMSDLEANSTFAFYTSVFLSGGAGENFSGGVQLYADNHCSNSNPRKKIHRGVTIDGSKGRVVVSSGGWENRRCKFPTNMGIRAVLQVWWDTRTNVEKTIIDALESDYITKRKISERI